VTWTAFTGGIWRKSPRSPDGDFLGASAGAHPRVERFSAYSRQPFGSTRQLFTGKTHLIRAARHDDASSNPIDAQRSKHPSGKWKAREGYTAPSIPSVKSGVESTTGLSPAPLTHAASIDANFCSTAYRTTFAARARRSRGWTVARLSSNASTPAPTDVSGVSREEAAPSARPLKSRRRVGLQFQPL
jgi:hypothetical protein